MSKLKVHKLAEIWLCFYTNLDDLGAMVYSACYYPISNSDKIKELGVAGDLFITRTIERHIWIS